MDFKLSVWSHFTTPPHILIQLLTGKEKQTQTVKSICQKAHKAFTICQRCWPRCHLIVPLLTTKYTFSCFFWEKEVQLYGGQNKLIEFQYVLIIWQGEGTPILRKSACAHHAADVTKYNILWKLNSGKSHQFSFRFMNVTTSVQARSEEELDPEQIKVELDKSSKY